MWRNVLYTTVVLFMAIVVLTGLAQGYSMQTVILRSVVASGLMGLWAVLVMFSVAVMKVDINKGTKTEQDGTA